MLAVIGLMAFDTISIFATRMSLADTGSLAARAASSEWARSHDIQDAFNAAWASATESSPGTRVDTATFTVDRDSTVHLVVRRDATTVLVGHVGWTEQWADVSVSASGRSDLS